MKKLLLSISIFALAGAAFSQAPCSDLFFSEYIEGTSNNKAFEIYNPTSSAIDLSNYHVVKFSNGTSTPNDTLWMTGMLPAGDTYNVVNPSADSLNLEIFADTTGTITFYNGNDALYLYRGNFVIDVIGDQLGDPAGSHWAVGSGFTNEFTLVRKANVFAGTTTWAGVGDTQWDVYPQNDFTHFNAHTMDPCSTASVNDDIIANISMYPNPTTGVLHINSEATGYEVVIIDLTGKTVFTKVGLSNNQNIDLTDFNNGIYVVKVRMDGSFITKKIVVRK